MQSAAKTLSAGGGASLCCLLLLWIIYSHLLREGQLVVGTCEIVMLNRDSSVPRRTIARQTARCACRRGLIAGTTRARPACVDAFAQGAVVGQRGKQQGHKHVFFKTKQWPVTISVSIH
ncbi:protein FAM19A3-like isoform X2 [Xiphophorus maculatus]|uniref:protein FAM19A3-like isoform X2 n=1 Tax=Xiphophorus maculatus TaxID=8083 RepID=UPI000C6D2352|nr:protein FAM19A3-like isoform X2 [Xiphophorus maculatus]